jgi:hypothetical protein
MGHGIEAQGSRLKAQSSRIEAILSSKQMEAQNKYRLKAESLRKSR